MTMVMMMNQVVTTVVNMKVSIVVNQLVMTMKKEDEKKRKEKEKAKKKFVHEAKQLVRDIKYDERKQKTKSLVVVK